MSLSEGTKLGRYEIRSKIGEDGMGEVYLAEDTKLARKVAITLLPVASVTSDPANRRLLREARVAARLDHPNICSIYGVGELDGLNYICMQYLEGETLQALISRQPAKIKNGH